MEIKIVKDIFKSLFVLLIIAVATIFFVQCTSKDKYRKPSNSGHTVVDQNTVEVDGDLGTVIIDWDRAGDHHHNHSGPHRPSYESVHLNMRVVCKGSNTPIPFSRLKVCHFLGTDIDDNNKNKIYVGYKIQGLPIVELNQGQLEIIKENDQLCNETKEAVFDLNEICSTSAN
ncbi:MAG: hypothetical protein HRT44_11225 [Bdellovibrionales bacterium]|nr:hypothetical protein [Bdellovibrionales bacterium]NQZ19812.1 hypothetical protein [Bdellovibrionales bacterium]